MASKTPQPLPGADLVPKLLAYELMRACEEGEIQSLIIITVDSEGVWESRISSGVMAADISFAGTMLHNESLRLSMDPDAADPAEEDEGEE